MPKRIEEQELIFNLVEQLGRAEPIIAHGVVVITDEKWRNILSAVNKLINKDIKSK